MPKQGGGKLCTLAPQIMRCTIMHDYARLCTIMHNYARVYNFCVPHPHFLCATPPSCFRLLQLLYFWNPWHKINMFQKRIFWFWHILHILWIHKVYWGKPQKIQAWIFLSLLGRTQQKCTFSRLPETPKSAPKMHRAGILMHDYARLCTIMHATHKFSEGRLCTIMHDYAPCIIPPPPAVTPEAEWHVQGEVKTCH